jgi:hypothetical protein
MINGVALKINRLQQMAVGLLAASARRHKPSLMSDLVR